MMDFWLMISYILTIVFFGAIGGIIGFIIKKIQEKRKDDEFDVYALNKKA